MKSCSWYAASISHQCHISHNPHSYLATHSASKNELIVENKDQWIHLCEEFLHNWIHFLIYPFPLYLLQPSVQIIDVKVLNDSFVVCLFKPNTLYSIRLRHQFRESTAPWSEWSNRGQGRTGEAGERTRCDDSADMCIFQSTCRPVRQRILYAKLHIFCY